VRMPRGAVPWVAALIVTLTPLVAAPADADEGARGDVYLVGRAGQPALARQIRDRLETIGPVRVRRVPRAPARVDHGWAITIEGREARIRDLAEDRIVRRVPLRRGLDAAGRAAIAQALRTVVEASRG